MFTSLNKYFKLTELFGNSQVLKIKKEKLPDLRDYYDVVILQRYMDSTPYPENDVDTIRHIVFDRYFENNVHKKVLVSLDGHIGYSSYFLKSIFGELSDKYGKDVVNNTLDIVCYDEPLLIDEIKQYIDNEL